MFVRSGCFALDTQCHVPVSLGGGPPLVEPGVGSVRTVETIGAIVVCAAALVISLIMGYRWTLGPPWHLIAGVVVGEICAAVYFAVATWVGRAWPGVLDARVVGVHLMVLVLASGFSGGLGAWFGYRKSTGRGLF